MRRRRRDRSAVMRSARAVKGAAVLLALFSALRLLSTLGAEDAMDGLLADIVSRDGVTEAILCMELGGESAEPSPAELSPEPETPAPKAQERLRAPLSARSVAAESADERIPVRELKRVFSGDLSAERLSVKNYTDYDIDCTALLNEPLTLRDTSADGPLVLVIHTHGSEAYAPDPGDTYEESDPSRTEDKTHSVIRVGDELTAALAERGIPAVHDRELYDYPSYTGSYARSLESVEAWLEAYPSLQLVVDLHRDAIENEDGTYVRTVASFPGGESAQVMLVAGTDYSGLEHPAWRENLKLALRLQYAMEALYPTLARPLNISQYRYNQDVCPGALIVEVGTNGNTLSEAVTAVRLFADAAAEVVGTLEKN